jgi:hypothetical protein
MFELKYEKTNDFSIPTNKYLIDLSYITRNIT